MMETHVARERERIQALAEEYRSQGYEVVIDPEPHSLPDFLFGYRPGLVVTRGGETTVIEVKTRRSLPADAQARHLARLVEEQPGWRFELVIVNDEPAGPPAGSVAFDSARAQRALDEGRMLLVGGYVGPAMLSSWSALEATLRLLLDAEGVEPRRLDPAHLLKQAVEEGVVSRGDYKVLRDLLAGRNAIAHGYENASVTPEAASQLLGLTHRLLNEASSPESA